MSESGLWLWNAFQSLSCAQCGDIRDIVVNKGTLSDSLSGGSYWEVFLHSPNWDPPASLLWILHKRRHIFLPQLGIALLQGICISVESYCRVLSPLHALPSWHELRLECSSARGPLKGGDLHAGMLKWRRRRKHFLAPLSFQLQKLLSLSLRGMEPIKQQSGKPSKHLLSMEVLLWVTWAERGKTKQTGAAASCF